MANALDIATEDQREDGNSLQRVYIYGDDQRPYADEEVPYKPDNQLTRAVAPNYAGPAGRTFTLEDLQRGVQALRDYIGGNVTAANDFAKRFTNFDRQFTEDVLTLPQKVMADPQRANRVGQRFLGGENWLVKMLESGATLPGDVLSGKTPFYDPETGQISNEVIERAMDTAGLVVPGALTQPRGTATLGTGPVRQGPIDRTQTGWTFKDVAFPHKHMEPGDWRKVTRATETGEGIQRVELPIRALNATQKAVNPDFANKISAGKNDAPFVIKKNGQYYVQDGHHDLVAAADRGQQTAKVRLVDLDPPTVDPNQMRLLSDTGTSASGVSALANSAKAPVFYSAVEHAVTNAAQDTMSPAQWSGWLKNQPGVKTEELAWTGLEDWLAGQKGKVKKEDVQRYLDEHKVEIKDVTKSKNTVDEAYLQDTVDDYMESARGQFYDEHQREPTPREEAQLRREIEEDLRQNPVDYDEDLGGTKYSSYQLPGGENYREHLLTLPPKPPVQAYAIRYKDGTQMGSAFPSRAEAEATMQELFPGRQDLEVVPERSTNDGVRTGTKPNPDDYKSSHWDGPNVLAHVRTNDRDVGGVPSLHLEEIQSDWHQQGRKQGYQGKEPTVEEIEAKASHYFDTVVGKDGTTWSKLPETEKQKWREEARAALKDPRTGGGVPDAPFKTAWPELALKRMVRMAAEEGKSRISWTPGEAQAARYDLSKHFTEISANPSVHNSKPAKTWWPKAKSGQDYGSIITTPEGEIVQAAPIWGDVKGKNIADVVGKDVAERGLKEGPQKLEGVDLKIGGEGMKGFYDQMLPKMVEKLGKAHGVKVNKTNLGGDGANWMVEGPIGEKYTLKNRDTGEFFKSGGGDVIKYPNKVAAETALKQKIGPEVYYFDIPNAWRDQALSKGFPLFAHGIPFPLTPVDYDPFKKDK